LGKGGIMMSAGDCIFCKIACGEIPCAKVHETPDFLAFLDIGPLAPGHTLLIPKRHFTGILDVPPDVLARVTAALPGLAKAIMHVSGATGLNVLQNTGASSGQAVPHLHFHLIPRQDGDNLGYRWNAGTYAAGRATEIQAKIVEALNRM
jgi:histidine triad (HIT) family protein